MALQPEKAWVASRLVGLTLDVEENDRFQLKTRMVTTKTTDFYRCQRLLGPFLAGLLE